LVAPVDLDFIALLAFFAFLAFFAAIEILHQSERLKSKSRRCCDRQVK